MAEVQEQMREVLRLRNERAKDPHAPRLKLSELQSLARENIATSRAARAEAARLEMLEAQALADARTKAAGARAAAARQAQADAAASARAATGYGVAPSGARAAASARTQAAETPVDYADDIDLAGNDADSDVSGGWGDGAAWDDRGSQRVRAERGNPAHPTGRAACPGTHGSRYDADAPPAHQRYTDAQVSTLEARFDKRLALTQQSIERVASRAYSGVAAAMAMPNLTPREAGGTLVAAGAARYRSSSAFAAGVTYRTRDGRWLVHGALALTDRGDAGVRTHIGYEF